MMPCFIGLWLSGSITGRCDFRPSTSARSLGLVPRCSTTPIVAGRSGGKAANNSVNAATPPADAPMTTISRLIPSKLITCRLFDCPEVNRLVLLFPGMSRFDHGSNREGLLPHFVDTALHGFAFRWRPLLRCSQRLLIDQKHLLQEDTGGPQDAFHLRFLGMYQAPHGIPMTNLTDVQPIL